MEITISYKKALELLKGNQLYDGIIFISVFKSYFLWGRSYIVATNADSLTIVPFLNKNKPNIQKVIKVAKGDIVGFSAGKITRKFIINLKDGKTLKYSTNDVDYDKRVEIFNKWLAL